MKKSLLLHSCCAPCITVPVERLSIEYDITCYFYNPNIHPENEYHQRLFELKKILKMLDIRLVEAEYNSDHWFNLTSGLEDEPEGGKRCEICFLMRLENCAQYAKENSFDFFTTVLTISPHKNAMLINKIGNKLSTQFGIPFIEANFKKNNGFKRSCELSKNYNLYRQNYCGCLYSRR